MTVAIFGSCVTRDLFEDPSLRPRLGHYAARTSMISAVAPPVAIDADRVRLDSAWQRRSLLADFEKTFFASLAATRPDWLVIDLIDERFDLLCVGDSFVTNSSALQAADLDGQTLEGEHLRRMSAEGCELFDRAVAAFAERVTAIVPAERVLLHRALWCPRYRDDDAIVDFDERRIELCRLQNAMLTRGYDALADAFGSTASLAVDPASDVADAAHHWKLEPFHYTSSYNASATARMLDLLDGG
ncbi:MAG TPA: DUF6270 domain-containing protein [Solirubrobacteraceae bacterium]|nr:DUF6270 domain-containing protein [Solirubrobacteraceae bacterium]